MTYAYCNNGQSMRMVQDGWPLAAGEVAFPTQPTEVELEAAFPGRGVALAAEALKTAAQTALAKTDTSVLRIQEAIMRGATTATATDVVAFAAWRNAVRAILDGTDKTSTALPAQPAYPAGS